MTKLIYLASPYSRYKLGKLQAYKEVCAMAADFMEHGVMVFCPIAHSHAIETEGMDSVKDGDFWLEQDFAILDRCDELWVYKMPGWEESYGVQKEMERAYKQSIPVAFIDYV